MNMVDQWYLLRFRYRTTQLMRKYAVRTWAR